MLSRPRTPCQAVFTRNSPSGRRAKSKPSLIHPGRGPQPSPNDINHFYTGTGVATDKHSSSRRYARPRTTMAVSAQAWTISAWMAGVPGMCPGHLLESRRSDPALSLQESTPTRGRVYVPRHRSGPRYPINSLQGLLNSAPYEVTPRRQLITRRTTQGVTTGITMECAFRRR